jgi:DNA-binding transcriptional regulator GbsR (MarR family)
MADPAPHRPEGPTRLYIERFALTLNELGMQRMTARLLALFVCTDAETLTAPDVAQALSISPAAVSGALRTLQDAALIEWVPVPGARRKHYRLLGNAWTGAAAIKQERFVALADLAAEGLEHLPTAGPAAGRLGQMRDFYSFLADEMPGLRARWEARSSP